VKSAKFRTKTAVVLYYLVHITEQV